SPGSSKSCRGGQRKSRRSTGRLGSTAGRVRRGMSLRRVGKTGSLRSRGTRELLVAPEGLAGLELDFALGQPQITQCAAVEGGELTALAGAPTPGGENLLEGGESARQGGLGTEMEREIGHGTSPEWKTVGLSGIWRWQGCFTNNPLSC